MSHHVWPMVRLGDVVHINPPRPLAKGNEAPFVSMDMLEPFHREIPATAYRAFSGSGSRFQRDDTLLARITPCLENGKTAYMADLSGDVTGHGSTEFIVLTGKPGVTHPLFVYYLARSELFRQYAIQKMEGSSGRQRVPANAVAEYRFHLPPLDQQREIAHILGSLDDKIALNRKMNRTLEAMARALFRSWFVDFDPVRAKAEGRQPTGMDADTAALFPNGFEDSPLGSIPKGWQTVPLRDLVRLERGLSYKGQHLADAGVPMINLGCFQGSGRFNQSNLKFYDGSFKDRNLVRPGDLVMANTDITQKREVLGSPAIVPEMGTAEYLFSHHVYAIRFFVPNPTFRRILYYSLLQPEFRERAVGFATGTTVLALPQDTVLDHIVVVPPDEIQNVFEDIVAPMSRTMDSNLKQRETLAATRNALLPRLMSGELAVEEDRDLEVAA